MNMKTASFAMVCLTTIMGVIVVAQSPVAGEVEPGPPTANPASAQPAIEIGEEIILQGEGERTEEEIIQITEAMIHDYDEMGRYWIRVLEDEEGQLLTRKYEKENHRLFAINQRQAYAAKLLGKLRYPPAIPVLIKYIKLNDKTVTTISDCGDGFVCQESLGLYGDAAVPQLVEAYLDDTTRELRGHYNSVFGYGGTRKVFKAYFLGLQARGDKRIIKEDFEYIRHIR